MTISAVDYDFVMKVKEVYDLDPWIITNPTVQHEIDGADGQMTPTTTPAVTKVYSATRALSGGALTIDLTSMTGPDGLTITFDGLEVQLVKILATSTNTGSLRVKIGASNGYRIFGNSTSDATLFAGGCIMCFQNNGGQAVSSTTKTIDFSGTGTDGFQILIVAG